MSPFLQVKDLWKSFHHKEVLKSISFEVSAGDVLGIIGPNGAGKSTLLYILLGVILPDRGEIYYFGKNFFKNRSAILKRVGFASHYVSLPYSLTVKENLKVFAHLYEVRDAEKRIEELLKLFKLEGKKEVLTRALSSGEMMRLNLVRATLSDPDLLFLDEPTAGLDPEYVKYVGEILKELAEKRKKAIILTSHQLGELERIINRILLLKEGKILGFGSLEEVFSKFSVNHLEELYFKVFGEKNLS